MTDVAVYTASDNTVQRIGTWQGDDALQRFTINGSGQLVGSNHVADSAKMDGASAVAVYEIGEKDYAVVTGNISDSVRVVDISTPSSFVLKGSLSDGAALALDSPHDVAVYAIADKRYAVVGSQEGLQIVDVTDPDNIAASGDLTISDGIFNVVDAVAVYSVGSKHYAVVGSLATNNFQLANDGAIRGVQFIDVTDPANPSIVSRLSPAVGVVLDRTGDLAIHRVGDRVFAVVPASAPQASAGVRQSGLSDERIRQTDGFSIIDVTDPASPKPLVSASHSVHAGYLRGARAVTTFTKNGRHYGVVGNEAQVTHAKERDGVQVFEMVFLTADAGTDQMGKVGSTVTLDGSGSVVTNGGNLTYSWSQVSGPDVTLNEVSGSPHQATFTMPDTESDLVFALQVSQGAPTHVIDVDQITVSEATGVTLSPSKVSVVAGATTTYTAVLGTQPTANVTVTPTSGTMSRATVSGALTFTSSNWNTAKSFTVTGVAAGTSEITHAATSSDTNYEISTAGTVTATVTPQPATVTLTTSASGNTVAEGGGSVTVTATLDNVGATAVSVTLTATNASTAASGDYTLPSVFTIPAGQTVATATVQITDDDLDEDNETVVLSASGTGLTVTPVTLTITDNDTAGVTLSTQTVSLAQDATGTYTVVLDTQPTADVTVTATSGSQGRATVSAARTFSASNWDTAQSFTVTAVAAGTSVVAHAATSSDTDYGIGSVGTVTVTVTQTATPPSTLRLTTNKARVAEDGGPVTVTARLNTAATSPVTVTLTAANASTADSGDYTLPAAFTIQAGQFSATATIQITDDRDTESDETVVLSASAASLTVTGVTFAIAENDDHGVSVTPTARTVFVGRQATYRVRLNTRPSADVTVTASSGTPTNATVAPAALTFTSDNWTTRQTFTLTGVETGASTVTHAVSGSDPQYPASMNVDSVDARVTVFVPPPVFNPGPPPPPPPPPEPSMLVLTTNAANNTIVEGGSVTVTATLDEAATSAVSVTLTATGTATADEDYTLPPAFTIAAGQTTAAGTIQITDDETAEDPETVILTATDTGLTVTPVTLTITDAPGVSLLTSTVSLQEGKTAVYTVVLDTQPSASVTVTASSGTPDAATVSEALTFTTSNWGTAQTFTVTGTSTGTSEITHTATSNDPNYTIPTIGTVTATTTGTDTDETDGADTDGSDDSGTAETDDGGTDSGSGGGSGEGDDVQARVRVAQCEIDYSVTESPFADVDDSSFAYRDVACLAELGVTQGTSDGTYSPKRALRV